MLFRLVDEKDRLPFASDVPFVLESREDSIEMLDVIGFSRISLFDEGVPAAVRPEPEAFPGFVGPGQCKRKIGFPTGQDFVERTFQQALSVPEPIMPIDKPFYSILTCHLSLCLPSFRHPKVIVAEIGRDMGLIMTGE